MKDRTIKASFVALALALAVSLPSVVGVGVGLTGCSTTNGATNVVAGTNGEPNQVMIDSIAVVLRGSARAGAVFAIQDDPENAKYFQLAAAAIGTFATGTKTDPASFQAALVAVGVPDNQWVRLGLGTVVDLYQFYYGAYVKGQVANNAYARAFLRAVQDGFNEALGEPTAHIAAAHRPAPAGVFPRPIKK